MGLLYGVIPMALINFVYALLENINYPSFTYNEDYFIYDLQT
jgi:hypothetical protein